MKKGQRIIWDSGYGYDLGIYESEEITQGLEASKYSVYLLTARPPGKILTAKEKITEYTQKEHFKMIQKYGVRHSVEVFDKIETTAKK